VIARGLRADGVGTILGGIFNTFAYTSFSQNVGLVGVIGVPSRWVTATGGAIMIALGLLPKMSALVEALPQVVLGDAGLVMFGIVATTFFRYTPEALHPLLESGILLAAIVSVVLNLFFNGLRSVEAAQHGASMTAAAAEHA
jgi:NCS2 family nucleobase:cation symporter-2